MYYEPNTEPLSPLCDALTVQGGLKDTISEQLRISLTVGNLELA